MPPRFQTVYDIAQELLPHPAYLIGSIMLFLAGLLRLVYQTRRKKARGSGWLLVALAVAFGGVTCLMPMWDVHVLKQAERQGTAFQVEGPITAHVVRKDTVPGPRLRLLTYEEFTVANVRFGFYREKDGAGFHNGGRNPIDLGEGHVVRVLYLPERRTDSPVPSRILRLDVAV